MIKLSHSEFYKKLFYHTIAPLSVGYLIYVFFRSNQLLNVNVDSIYSEINCFKNYSSDIRKLIPDWISYSLTDGIWVYSFTSTFIIISEYVCITNQSIIFFPYCTSICLEILQLWHIYPGTFDFIDLLMFSLGFLLSIHNTNSK